MKSHVEKDMAYIANSTCLLLFYKILKKHINHTIYMVLPLIHNCTMAPSQ